SHYNATRRTFSKPESLQTRHRPEGVCLRGDGARAGKLRQQFLETVLKSPELMRISVFDSSLAQRQVVRYQRVQLSIHLGKCVKFSPPSSIWSSARLTAPHTYRPNLD